VAGHIVAMNSNNRHPLTGMAGRTLPEREAHMYDEAGFLECDDAYRLQVLANVADYARLIESGLTTERVGRKLHVDVAAVRKRSTSATCGRSRTTEDGCCPLSSSTRTA